MKAKRKKLTINEQSIINEYLRDHNKTQAYIRSKFPTCSPQSAPTLACRVFRRVHVKQALAKKLNKITDKAQEEMNKESEQIEVTLTNVVLELGKVAFHNTQELYNDQGNLIAVGDLPPHVAAAISGIESEETRRGAGKLKKEKGAVLKKIRMHSKVDALKELRKHFEGDRLTLGVSPEMLKLTMDIINALPEKEAKRVWAVVESQVKMLSEKAGPEGVG